jgi:hypothetical protein
VTVGDTKLIRVSVVVFVPVAVRIVVANPACVMLVETKLVRVRLVVLVPERVSVVVVPRTIACVVVPGKKNV